MLSNCQMIGFVPTADKEKAKGFYCDVLGFNFEKDDGFALVLRAGKTMIRVAQVPGFKPQQFTVLGWEVSEMDREVEELAAAGVTFERFGFLEQNELGIWMAPDGSKVAWFKDPDGNVLSVSQHARA